MPPLTGWEWGGEKWEVVTSKPPIADWSILSSHERQSSRNQCALLPSSAIATLDIPNPVYSQRGEEAMRPSRWFLVSLWMLKACYRDDVHCLKAVDSHPRGSVLISSHPGCVAKAL